MKYPITQIKCGNSPMSSIWVGLRYRSKDGEEHSLYIIGGEKTSAHPDGRTLVPIYFERDDQSLSCYEAADKILVADRSIILTLNKNGRVSLELPRVAEFVAEKIGKDFDRAKTMFVAMQKCHGGEVVNMG
jgi:hypothetical protein